jgi:hypothetical protein
MRMVASLSRFWGLLGKRARILCWFLAVLVSVTLGWIVLYETGHCRRTYSVLAPGEPVTLGGVEIVPSDIAELYMPRILAGSSLLEPEPSCMFYEVVPSQDMVTLIYRPTWVDERCPDPAIDWPYRAFRAAYYGMPTIDSEYIELDIDGESGNIEAIRFETAAAGGRESIQRHVSVQLLRNPSGSFDMIRDGKREDVIVDVPMLGSHVTLCVATWNHLFSLPSGERSSACELEISFAAMPLTDSAYAAFKYCRRSHGRYASHECTVALAILLLLATAPLLTLACLGIRERWHG